MRLICGIHTSYSLYISECDILIQNIVCSTNVYAEIQISKNSVINSWNWQSLLLFFFRYTRMQAALMTSPCVMLNTGKSWLYRRNA
ncbi:hypothetical protein I7I48_01297 [Histoplasma ohiense]|nr:hypothetical protein I7I48_01297 [Histoplasma ohiense (nom. inval.)]